MDRLKGKVAVETGGGAGIGRATCDLFAGAGRAVVVADWNIGTGADAAQAITQRGGRAAYVHVDVSDESSVEQLAAEAVRVFGTVHVLVNNAAVFVLRGMDATPEEWLQSLAVNVMG